MECYFDDSVVNSTQRIDQRKHLKNVFNKLRKHRLKMNPLKRASSHLTQIPGIIVYIKGLKFMPTKIDVIIRLLPPENSRELKGFHLCISANFFCLGDINLSKDW